MLPDRVSNNNDNNNNICNTKNKQTKKKKKKTRLILSWHIKVISGLSADLEVLSSSPAPGEIFSTGNGVPLNTAFYYHSPYMTEILLKRTQNLKSPIHPYIRRG